MRDVPNNPAGRLQRVLSSFHLDDEERSVAQWWDLICENCAPRSDSLSIRAEAGALLRDVDTAIEYLSPDDDKASYKRQRGAWSKAVFGWGLNARHDNGSVWTYPGTTVADPESVRWLSSLSSILRRDAPESSLRGSDEEIDSVLESTLERTDQLVQSIVAAGGELPPELRAALLRAVLDVRDDVVFVRLRGWRRLYSSAAANEATLSTVAEDVSVSATSGKLDLIKGWASIAREICVEIERIVVPTATGIAVAIGTSDVAAGLGAGITARLAIGGGSSGGNSEGGPPQLPAGSPS